VILSPELVVPFSGIYFLAIFVVLIFSSTPSAVKAVGVDAVTLGLLRLCIACTGMTSILVWQRKLTCRQILQWDRRTWVAMSATGVAFGIHWLLFMSSIKIANAAIGAIGFSTYGLHLLVLGWLLGFSKVTLFDLAGIVLACIGTYLLIPEFNLDNHVTLGLIVGILGGLAAAVLPLIHQANAGIDVGLRAWGQFTFAIPVFLLCWNQMQWEITPRDIPLIFYLGLGVALIGHGLWVHVTTQLSTTTVSILSYLYLPISLLVGYLILGDSERLSGRTLAGTILVLIANALVLWSQAKLRSLEAEIIETV
jgi:drug/metabolite transporter (DMT)-like permease